MTVKYGFYNSIGGDRTYDAIDFSKIFDGVITDGVFESIGNKLMVVDGASGMDVVVGDGKAWFDHTWTINDSSLVITLDPSDLVLPRIDAIVLEVNASNAVRVNSIKKITGTPATVPVEPELIDTSEIHQYPLAWIAVGAGVSGIVPGNITNLVGSVLCPFVSVPEAQISDTTVNVLEVQVFS